VTFGQEFLALLKEAGVSYRPKYVLGRIEYRASGAPRCWGSPDTQPCPLLPPLAALERVASAVFFTENRIECNAPTSTTGKQGPDWAHVWLPAPTGRLFSAPNASAFLYTYPLLQPPRTRHAQRIPGRDRAGGTRAPLPRHHRILPLAHSFAADFSSSFYGVACPSR